MLALSVAIVAGCTEPGKTVAGSVKFVQGGTNPASPAPPMNAGATMAIAAGEDYIVSPRRAKVTFTSVNFKDASGASLGESELTNCTVTYDRTLTSGATLLDCPFTVPVGEVAQMQLFFDKTLDLLVSDATLGIYSNPASSTGFSTTAPAGGASFVSYTVAIGTGTTRSITVIFSSPVTVAEGDTPSMYVTLDMIHSVQLKVDAGGTTLTPNATNDPVSVFGGLAPGTSRLFTGATSIDGYKVQGVPWLRVFYDNAGQPRYAMIGPNFCGADGGSKAAWATAPAENDMIGGWLGKDAAGNVSFALPSGGTFTTYAAYYVMADVSTIGSTTTLNCKVTSSPPLPADGKTYASGAPTLSAPDKSVVLRLIAK
jgi:hypothetical protein